MSTGMSPDASNFDQDPQPAEGGAVGETGDAADRGSNQRGFDRLSGADQLAVDRLAGSRWRHEAGVGAGSSSHAGISSQDDARAARVSSLLMLLEAGRAPASSAALVDATLARIAQAQVGAPRDQGVPAEDAVELSIDDQEALDALVLAGFAAKRVPSSLRPRAQRIEAMADLVSRTPVARMHRPDLVDATARRILKTPRRTSSSELPSSRGSGWRLADLVSVAAVLLIGASVIWPMAASVRNHALRTGCASNLAAVASALGVYSNDFQGELPMATAGFGGGTWWNVGAGPGKSNSANLFTLARARYASLTDLACGGNQHAVRGTCSQESTDWGSIQQVSYSYQIIDRAAGPAPTWSREPGSIVLADRSPVTLRASRGEPVYILENSPNHDGRGQWILRNDGSSVWTNSPEVGGDNIWLPGQLEAAIAKIREQQKLGLTSGVIQGNELPVSANDAFLGP
jgi:hypothetical protein